MNLLQRFCTAVVDVSDTWGASMQGVDVQTHRANLYGHPEGIAAARAARENGHARVASPAAGTAAVDRDEDDSDLDWGANPPLSVALNSPHPTVRMHAYDLEDEMSQARGRDLDGIESF